VTALHRRPAPLLALILAGLAALLLTAAVPTAHSAATRTCALTSSEQDPRGEVPTYNLSLKSRGTPCTTAKKVMKAFHKCRSAASVTCSKKVLTRWTCTGRKTSSTPVLFYASFTCKWGSRRVTSTYQRNT
jgi:hypothetical protein